MHIRLAKVLNDDAVCITSVAVDAVNLCLVTAIQCGVDRIDVSSFELLGWCCHFVLSVIVVVCCYTLFYHTAGSLSTPPVRLSLLAVPAQQT